MTEEVKLKWRCLNPECGRTFWIPARKSVERKPSNIEPWTEATTRTIIEKSVCPHCEHATIEPFLATIKTVENEEGKT